MPVFYLNVFTYFEKLLNYDFCDIIFLDGELFMLSREPPVAGKVNLLAVEFLAELDYVYIIGTF